MPRRTSIVLHGVAATFVAFTFTAVATADPGATAEPGPSDEQTPGLGSGARSAPGADVARTDDTEAHGSRRTDHFRIGALAGIGFPRPLAVEGMVVLEKSLALGVEYSCLPDMTISGVSTSFWALAGDVRIFPFGGGFFLGARAGHQHLSGSATFTVPRYGSLNESLAMDTTFVNPRIGFLWTWDPGVSVGIDLGVQIPLGVTASNTLPPGTQLRQELDAVSTSFGRNVLPTIDLLRVGLLL